MPKRDVASDWCKEQEDGIKTTGHWMQQGILHLDSSVYFYYSSCVISYFKIALRVKDSFMKTVLATAISVAN